MAPPLNPRNVPTSGHMTYAALERITPEQMKMLGHLKRIAGNPPTWDATCGLVLGDDWDGVYETLSKAAASWLITGIQRGLVEVATRREDLDIPGSPV